MSSKTHYFRIIRLTNSADSASPAEGYRWKILSGEVDHKAGSATIVYLMVKGTSYTTVLSRVDTAIADINQIPLGVSLFIDVVGAAIPYLAAAGIGIHGIEISSECRFLLVGAAAATAQILVEETQEVIKK